MLKPMPVRFPPAMRERLEEIQRSRLDAPDLSTIIRELVAEALEARGRRK